MKNNVLQTVNNGLCMGCGICQDICTKKCIRIEHGIDLNYPIVDNNNCTECGLCLKVCSGIGINIGERSERLFNKPDINYNTILGYYHRCYTGYSLNKNIRFHSSSGGVLSTFLIYLLRHNIIDGAAITGWSNKDPMRPQPFIARSPKEVICGRGSKYCVVSMEGIANEIINNPGKYVVVGLPCHIHAYRKFADINKKFRESVIGYFAIYCSSNRTMRSQKYLMSKYGVDKSKVKYFAYRDEGCLGNMNFRGESFVPIQRVAYENYWQGMRGFFNVPRCSTCIDHYGELADVCFGDIFMGEFANDKIGINSLLSRKDFWTKLLTDAAKNRWIQIKKLEPDDLIKCQGYAIRQKKGKGVAAAFAVRKLLGMSIPEYDVSLIAKAEVKDCLKEVAKIGMRWMGRHEWTWPIIKVLHKDNKRIIEKGRLIFETAYNGNNYIANKEFHAFNNLSTDLKIDWKGKDWEKTKKEVYAAFKHYLEFIVAYCDIEIKDKSFTIDEMAQIVFGDYDKRKWSLEQYRKSLFAVKLYSEHLLALIKEKNALQYDNLIHTVKADFEDLICCYEVYGKGSLSSIVSLCGSNPYMNHRDIEWAGETLLDIDLHDSITQISSRDIRPYNIIAARQLIENIGRKFIGFSEIVDTNGNTIKQFSQISWTFLSDKYEDIKNIISIPLSIHSISTLNSWCNHFTHTAIIEPIYLQYYTWVILNELNRPAVGGKMSNGKEFTCLTHGNLRIKDWAKLKAEFESYIINKRQYSTVVWMDKKDVQAYIEK